jgi:hypothetical protein
VEKAREKYPERLRKGIGVGVIRDKEVAGSRRLTKTVLSASGDSKNVVGKLDDRHGPRRREWRPARGGSRPRS